MVVIDGVGLATTLEEQPETHPSPQWASVLPLHCVSNSSSHRSSTSTHTTIRTESSMYQCKQRCQGRKEDCCSWDHSGRQVSTLVSLLREGELARGIYDVVSLL